MSCPGEEVSSDEEIFFGKQSLKEIKKHIFLHDQGLSKSYNAISPEPDHSKSLKIFETHSQPNLRRKLVNSPSKKISSVPSSPALHNGVSDESFIQMENIVSKLCLSPAETEKLELNNTLEVINYILNNGPNQNATKTNTEKDVAVKINSSPSPRPPKLSPRKDSTPRQPSPNKKVENINIKESPKFFTPAKSIKKEQADVFVTPSSVCLKAKTPSFKTPANLLKKPSASSLKKTPYKSNAYQHIASPIASYIKNCPQSPLVKDVHPRKPLPGPSSIPKYVKNPPQSQMQNKENFNLPSVAYKSAKKTKMTYLPDEEKLPKSQWFKKTLPRPTVVKHEGREMTVAAKPLQKLQEDSFANLSCVQAEVSLCTQKTAFKTKKHIL